MFEVIIVELEELMSIENNIPSKKEIKGFGEIRPEISVCFKIIVS